MATIAVQTYNESGTDLTMSSAAGGGDQFVNTGKEVIIIYNGDASGKTVTVTAQTTSFTDSKYGSSVKEDQDVTVSAGGVAIMGPFPRQAFNDGSGYVQITYSAVTSLEVAVARKS